MPDDERRQPSGDQDGDADLDADRGHDDDLDADRGHDDDLDADRGHDDDLDADRGHDDDLDADRGPGDDPDGGPDGDVDDSGTESASPSGSGGREVVVPMRLYKTVTVFSTLLAIVCILGGFVLLDSGTQRATASPEDVSLPVVALGLALIVGGSAVYAFSTRFRTEGMGKPKDDTDEPTNNG